MSSSSTLIIAGRLDYSFDVKKSEKHLRNGILAVAGTWEPSFDSDFGQLTAAAEQGPAGDPEFGLTLVKPADSDARHLLRVVFNPTADQLRASLKEALLHALGIDQLESAGQPSQGGRVRLVYTGQVVSPTGEWLLADAAVSGHQLIAWLDSETIVTWRPQVAKFPNLGDRIDLHLATPLLGTGWPTLDKSGRPIQLKTMVDVRIVQLQIALSSCEGTAPPLQSDNLGHFTSAVAQLHSSTLLPMSDLLTGTDPSESTPDRVLGLALAAHRPSLYVFPTGTGGGVSNTASALFSLQGFTLVLGGSYVGRTVPQWWRMARHLSKLDAVVLPDWSAASILAHQFLASLPKDSPLGALLLPPAAATTDDSAGSADCLSAPTSLLGSTTPWMASLTAADVTPPAVTLYAKLGWGSLLLQPLSQRAGLLLKWLSDGRPALGILLPANCLLGGSLGVSNPEVAVARLVKALASGGVCDVGGAVEGKTPTKTPAGVGVHKGSLTSNGLPGRSVASARSTPSNPRTPSRTSTIAETATKPTPKPASQPGTTPRSTVPPRASQTVPAAHRPPSASKPSPTSKPAATKPPASATPAAKAMPKPTKRPEPTKRPAASAGPTRPATAGTTAATKSSPATSTGGIKKTAGVKPPGTASAVQRKEVQKPAPVESPAVKAPENQVAPVDDRHELAPVDPLISGWHSLEESQPAPPEEQAIGHNAPLDTQAPSLYPVHTYEDRPAVKENEPLVASPLSPIALDSEKEISHEPVDHTMPFDEAGSEINHEITPDQEAPVSEVAEEHQVGEPFPFVSKHDEEIAHEPLDNSTSFDEGVHRQDYEMSDDVASPVTELLTESSLEKEADYPTSAHNEEDVCDPVDHQMSFDGGVHKHDFELPHVPTSPISALAVEKPLETEADSLAMPTYPLAPKHDEEFMHETLDHLKHFDEEAPKHDLELPHVNTTADQPAGEAEENKPLLATEPSPVFSKHSEEMMDGPDVHTLAEHDQGLLDEQEVHIPEVAAEPLVSKPDEDIMHAPVDNQSTQLLEGSPARDLELTPDQSSLAFDTVAEPSLKMDGDGGEHWTTGLVSREHHEPEDLPEEQHMDTTFSAESKVAPNLHSPIEMSHDVGLNSSAPLNLMASSEDDTEVSTTGNPPVYLDEVPDVQQEETRHRLIPEESAIAATGAPWLAADGVLLPETDEDKLAVGSSDVVDSSIDSFEAAALANAMDNDEEVPTEPESRKAMRDEIKYMFDLAAEPDTTQENFFEDIVAANIDHHSRQHVEELHHTSPLGSPQHETGNTDSLTVDQRVADKTSSDIEENDENDMVVTVRSEHPTHMQHSVVEQGDFHQLSLAPDQLMFEMEQMARQQSLLLQQRQPSPIDLDQETEETEETRLLSRDSLEAAVDLYHPEPSVPKVDQSQLKPTGATPGDGAFDADSLHGDEEGEEAAGVENVQQLEQFPKQQEQQATAGLPLLSNQLVSPGEGLVPYPLDSTTSEVSPDGSHMPIHPPFEGSEGYSSYLPDSTTSKDVHFTEDDNDRDGKHQPIGFDLTNLPPLAIDNNGTTDDMSNLGSPDSEASIDSVVQQPSTRNLPTQPDIMDDFAVVSSSTSPPSNPDTGAHGPIGFDGLMKDHPDEVSPGLPPGDWPVASGLGEAALPHHVSSFRSSNGVAEVTASGLAEPSCDAPHASNGHGIAESNGHSTVDSRYPVHEVTQWSRLKMMQSDVDPMSRPDEHSAEEQRSPGQHPFLQTPPEETEAVSPEGAEMSAFDPLKSWGLPQGLPAPVLPVTAGRASTGRPTPSSAGRQRPSTAPLVAKRPSQSKERPTNLPPGPAIYLDVMWIPGYLARVPYPMAVEFFARVRCRTYIVSGEALHPLVGEALLEGKSKWTADDMHLLSRRVPATTGASEATEPGAESDPGHLKITLLPTDEPYDWACWLRTPCGRVDGQTGESRLTANGFSVLPSVSLCDIDLSAGQISIRCEGVRVEF